MLDIKNMSDSEIISLIELLEQELKNRSALQDIIKSYMEKQKDKKGE